MITKLSKVLLTVRELCSLEKKYGNILKQEQSNSREGENEIHRLIDTKYNEIKEELENYNNTQKENFKGLEKIIEVRFGFIIWKSIKKTIFDLLKHTNYYIFF